MILLFVLLALVSLSLGWLAFGFHAWITFFNVLVLWMIIVGLILYQVRKVNRDLTRFFQLIRDQESTQGFDETKSDSGFRDLHRQMNDIFRDISAIRSERERDYLFFKTIFDHADVGLVVYDDQENIMLINQAARDLLGISKTATIKDFLSQGTSGEAFVKNIRPGERIMMKFLRNGEMVQLSARSRNIRVPGKSLTLLSLQNIRPELEQHETESWQKLIRVFIHEIINSVSPITLTASGIIAMLEDQSKTAKKDVKQRGEMLAGLRAIRKRSKGMAAFMESYRQLARIPSPDFAWVEVARLFENVGRLMQQDFQSRNVNFTTRLSPKEIKLWCDEKLIEQVLINLLRNSLEALINFPSPLITLSCVALQDRVEITVRDNGPGIDPETAENIFVPFFSTKPEGTGIGLSLSRQIMNLHSGRVSVHSKKGETIFILSFPVLSA
jgi:signal transduction histidine kinase